jgi:hypothetical protein
MVPEGQGGGRKRESYFYTPLNEDGGILDSACPSVVRVVFWTYLCPPSKKGGHIALLLSVCRSVGASAVSVHFLRTGSKYCNEIWYTDLL